MSSTLGALAGLFAVAFGAATLLPLQSEALLGALLLAGFDPWALVAVATLGNVAGSCVNWWLGTQVERLQGRRWFPATASQLARARRAYARYGRYTLLFAWVPVLGDPLTLVAGVLRERFGVFLLLVGIGKLARYAGVAWMVVQMR